MVYSVFNGFGEYDIYLMVVDLEILSVGVGIGVGVGLIVMIWFGLLMLFFEVGRYLV